MRFLDTVVSCLPLLSIKTWLFVDKQRQNRLLSMKLWVLVDRMQKRKPCDFLLGCPMGFFRFAQATSSITNPWVLTPYDTKKEALRLPFRVPYGIRTHDIQNHNLTL